MIITCRNCGKKKERKNRNKFCSCKCFGNYLSTHKEEYKSRSDKLSKAQKKYWTKSRREEWSKRTKKSFEGRVHPKSGKKMPQSAKDKISKHFKGLFAGDKHYKWKGDKVGYGGIHTWVTRYLGKARKCEACSVSGKKRYHWANKSREYKRTLDDWVQLCPSCHLLADFRNIPIQDFIDSKRIEESFADAQGKEVLRYESKNN